MARFSQSNNLVVPTSITDSNGNDFISFSRTGTGTARIATPQDDLSLHSAKDITIYAGQDGPGNVYIGWGDATYTPDSTNRVATIGDIQSGTTGDITFNGIQIIGDGTMELVPDANLIENILNADQYIIVDPTAPNHIHIRAGGAIDASTADLIIGGEDTNLLVSDTGDYVDINTTSASGSYVYRFDSSGYFTGPAMGGLFVSGLLNGEADLWLGSNYNVVLSPGPENSAYLGDASIVDNQIATLGDLPSGATGSFQTATHDITVTNGIITTIAAL